MAVVEGGMGLVRSLDVWLDANRAPAPAALFSLYFRLKAAPKSVIPIAITISKGNETANSMISDPSVRAHPSSHRRQLVLTELGMPPPIMVTSVRLPVFGTIELAAPAPEIHPLPRWEERGCSDHNPRHSTILRISPLVRQPELAELKESEESEIGRASCRER